MNRLEQSERRTEKKYVSVHKSLHSQESVTDNIDVARVYSHFEEADLEVKSLIFLEDETFDDYRIEIQPDAIASRGIYAPLLQTALVRRSLESEDPHEAIKAELIAVHELAHSTGIDTPIHIQHEKSGRIFQKNISTFHPQRLGFLQAAHPGRPTNRGGFTEESYAELERGMYVRQHNLVSQLTRGALNLEQVHNEEIPLHYWVPDILHKLQIAPGAIGAAILELLIKEDSSLLGTLREGRRSVAGLRDVAQKIDAIKPGLYKDMRHIESHVDGRRLLSDTQDSLK
jgi:hypothetical protein